MTILLSLLQTAPLVVGGLSVLVTLIAILTPWGKLVKFIALTILIGLCCIVLFFEHLAKRFADWMRKPADWEEDMPDLFI